MNNLKKKNILYRTKVYFAQTNKQKVFFKYLRQKKKKN